MSLATKMSRTHFSGEFLRETKNRTESPCGSERKSAAFRSESGKRHPVLHRKVAFVSVSSSLRRYYPYQVKGFRHTPVSAAVICSTPGLYAIIRFPWVEFDRQILYYLFYGLSRGYNRFFPIFLSKPARNFPKIFPENFLSRIKPKAAKCVLRKVALIQGISFPHPA